MVPFKSGMVVVGRDFCGREREVAALTDYLKACARVCLIGERRIGKTSLVHETVRRLRGHSLVFIDMLGVKTADHVTGQQLDCLRALAEVGGAATMGGEFLRQTGITNNSSIQRALNSLLKKRILFGDGKRFRFCDPFFGEWIKLMRL